MGWVKVAPGVVSAIRPAPRRLFRMPKLENTTLAVPSSRGPAPKDDLVAELGGLLWLGRHGWDGCLAAGGL